MCEYQFPPGVVGGASKSPSRKTNISSVKPSDNATKSSKMPQWGSLSTKEQQTRSEWKQKSSKFRDGKLAAHIRTLVSGKPEIAGMRTYVRQQSNVFLKWPYWRIETDLQMGKARIRFDFTRTLLKNVPSKILVRHFHRSCSQEDKKRNSWKNSFNKKKIVFQMNGSCGIFKFHWEIAISTAQI